MAEDERTRQNRNYLAQMQAEGRIQIKGKNAAYTNKPATINRVAEGLRAQQAVGLPLSVQAARGHAGKERGKVLKRDITPETYRAAKKAAKVPGVRVDSRGNVTIPIDPKNATAIRDLIAGLAKNFPNVHIFLKTPDGEKTLFKHGGIRAKELDALITEVEDEQAEERKRTPPPRRPPAHDGDEYESGESDAPAIDMQYDIEDEEDEDEEDKAEARASARGEGLMTFVDVEAEKQLGESPKKKKKNRTPEREREHSKRKRERAREKKARA